MAAKTNMAGKKAARKVAGEGKLATYGITRYVPRNARDRIRQSDDMGKSLSADRLRPVRTVANPGQGARGDRD